MACLKGEQRVRRPWWAPPCLSIVFTKAAKRNRQARVVSLKLEAWFEICLYVLTYRLSHYNFVFVLEEIQTSWTLPCLVLIFLSFPPCVKYVRLVLLFFTGEQLFVQALRICFCLLNMWFRCSVQYFVEKEYNSVVQGFSSFSSTRYSF